MIVAVSVFAGMVTLPTQRCVVITTRGRAAHRVAQRGRTVTDHTLRHREHTVHRSRLITGGGAADTHRGTVVIRDRHRGIIVRRVDGDFRVTRRDARERHDHRLVTLDQRVIHDAAHINERRSSTGCDRHRARGRRRRIVVHQRGRAGHRVTDLRVAATRRRLRHRELARH